MRRYTYLTLSQLAFAAALMLAILHSIDPGSLRVQQAETVYAAALLSMFVLLRSAARWVARSSPTTFVWLHAPMLITAWSIILLAIPGLLSFANPELVESIYNLVGIHYAYAAWGIVLTAVGLICLWVGYGLGLKIFSTVDFPRIFHSVDMSQSAVMKLYVIASLARLLRIAVTGISYGADRSRWGSLVSVSQWITYLESASLLVFSIVILQVLRRRWPFHTFVVIAAAEILFALTSGYMKPMLWLALIVGIAAGVMGIRVRKYIWYLVVFALMGILIVPIAQGLRQSIDDFNPRSPAEVLEATWQSFEASWGQGIDVGWTIFVDKMMGRQAEIAHILGTIMLKTPREIPYQGFEQFLAIPAYVIPRVIWQDKPILSRGLWFSVTYLNMPTDTTTSSVLTIFGETYIFAGWLGTSLALFGLGLMLAFLFRATATTPLLPVYLALIPNFLDIENQFTSMFVELAQSLVVLFIVHWLLVRLSTRSIRRRSTFILSMDRSRPS